MKFIRRTFLNRKFAGILLGYLIIWSSRLFPESINGIFFLTGGVITGYLVREKGWLYGMILTLVNIVVFILLIILIITFVLVQFYSSSLPKEPVNYQSLITSLAQFLTSKDATETFLISFTLTTLGGFLGEKIYKLRRN